MGNRYWIESVRDLCHTLKPAPVGYIASADDELSNSDSEVFSTDDEFFSTDNEVFSADDEFFSTDNEFYNADSELSNADSDVFSTDDEIYNADSDVAHTYKWAKNTPVPKNIFLFTRIFFGTSSSVSVVEILIARCPKKGKNIESKFSIFL